MKIRSFNNQINANRVIYIIIFLGTCVYAWMSGERLAYLTALVFFIVPTISCIVTFILLRGLKVEQTLPATIVKHQNGSILIDLHNPTPLPFSRLECIFYGNPYAIKTQSGIQLAVEPFKSTEGQIPFTVLFRGEYEIGLKSVIATDYLGLFRLKRKYRKQTKILALPRIVDFSNIPLSMSLVAEASARFDIRDEDYSIVSDIRPYIPTDSIKRVHWKLTAKRNEWLVKIFQSNALNHVSIIFDNLRLPLLEEEMYSLEDRMVESAVGLARHCLNQGMPVDFLSTDGGKASVQTAASFNTIYHMVGELKFEQDPMLSPVTILTQTLNDASGSVNAVVFTTSLTTELYERTVNSVNRGNYTAIMYFATEDYNAEYEQIFRILEDSGLPCFKVK